jgi:hypothetical protein
MQMGGSNTIRNYSLDVVACYDVNFSFHRFRRNGSVYGEVTIIVTEFTVNRKL